MRNGIFALLTGLVVVLVVGAAQQTSEKPDSYRAAYYRALKSGRPLVIYLTMRSCPACRAVERDLLASVRTKGEFCKVVYEDEPKLWTTLSKQGAAPEVLVYVRAPSKDRKRLLWRGTSYLGYGAIKYLTQIEHVTQKE